MPVALSDRDRALLGGDSGEGAAFAMRLVVAAAEALGAPRLIDISGAHVDSCLYHGEASIDFVERLVAGGARVSVPTTLNVGALDLVHPGLWRGDPAVAERGRLLMDRYRALGCRPTYTCAPYQLPWARPRLGEQVAWAESNAIVFCNSVLGARTNRYGDFLDVACAIAGRAPLAGLHRDEARRARLVLRLADDVPRDSLLPSLVGIALGRHAGSGVAVLEGLPADLGEDGLKAIGAAAASSGAVAMFHAVGLTPEAPTLEAALGGAEPEAVETITGAELRAIRDELSGAAHDAALRGVAIGTPHASLAQLREVDRLLAGRRPVVELVVSTARDVAAQDPALVERLEASGATLLVDTCSYVSPVFAAGDGAVMTDSGKWAYYAPSTIGAASVIGSTEDCIASALTGRVVRGSSAWDA
jgi:predicted aconitase